MFHTDTCERVGESLHTDRHLAGRMGGGLHTPVREGRRLPSHSHEGGSASPFTLLLGRVGKSLHAPAREGPS